MSSPRITRSTAARAHAQAISPDSVQEVNAHVPPVIVIAEAKPEPINVIAPMPPAVPIEEAASAAPALSISASKFQCFVSIRYNNSENERVDVVYRDHNLYISETYIDIDNKSQVMRNLATANQIQKWLTLWFTSALLDEFSAWKCVDVYFSMLPSIRINRQSLSSERISSLVPHIMESIQLLYDLAA